MTTDPSWLYSTIAQASAAIVAIIGGFITATVLMLTSEKRSLTNQLKNKQALLDSLTRYGDVTMPIRAGNKEIKTRPVSAEAKNISSLKEQISDLETTLESFGFPRLLGIGFLLLVIFAAVSVVLPIGLIFEQDFSLGMRWLVFILFLLGLVSIFAYIAFQIRELRRK